MPKPLKNGLAFRLTRKQWIKNVEGYQAKLKEVDLNKTRLEREIDSLPADAKYRERKLHDMTLRLDSLYDVIVELEEKSKMPDFGEMQLSSRQLLLRIFTKSW